MAFQGSSYRNNEDGRLYETFRDGTIVTQEGMLAIGDENMMVSPRHTLENVNTPGQSILDEIGRFTEIDCINQGEI